MTNDIFLYSVPSDANPNDVRLRDPNGVTVAAYSIAGAVTLTLSVAADMLEGRGIVGDVTLVLTPAGQMLEGRVFAGAVTLTLTPAALMVEGRGISGAVTLTITPAAEMLEGRILTGAVTLVLTPAAAMVYAAFTPAVIVGDITLTLLPAASLEYVAATPPPTLVEAAGWGGSATGGRRRPRLPIEAEQEPPSVERQEAAVVEAGAPVAPVAPAPVVVPPLPPRLIPVVAPVSKPEPVPVEVFVADAITRMPWESGELDDEDAILALLVASY